MTDDETPHAGEQAAVGGHAFTGFGDPITEQAAADRTIDSTLPVEMTWAEVRYVLASVRRDRTHHSANYQHAISHDNILRREAALQAMRKLDALIERLGAVDTRFVVWDEATFGSADDG